MKKILIIILFIPNIFFAQEKSIELNVPDSIINLKNYLQNHVYKILEFNRDIQDSISEKTVNISHEGVNTKIIIRDFNTIENPLIVINQFPLQNVKITGNIFLIDIDKIEITKPSQNLSEIYGSLAKYGLIKITMNKRKWKKIRKKYN